MQDINITFSLAEFVALAGGITVIIVAVKNIAQLNPMKDIKKKLANDFNAIGNHEERIKELEATNESDRYLILKSLQALMRNAQTGNNKEQLKEVSQELDNYILKK